MSNLINVALNMSSMSVSQKIKFGRQVADAMANHPSVFTTPIPSLAVVNSAINDLEIAMQDASDGGKSKTALMHDKEQTVYLHLKNLARYVEIIASGNAEIIHLATFSVKAVGIKQNIDFDIFLPDDLGAVGLKCKARKKVMYRWEYCKDPMGANQWLVGNITSVSSSFIGNLESNVKYWFRVVLITVAGENALPPKCILPL
ncbi:MAG: hypothetical protein JWO32_743 [Bacteroidetes bacterium]|nr:hypothetical protein [Bacteroidota bacterium]